MKMKNKEKRIDSGMRAQMVLGSYLLALRRE